MNTYRVRFDDGDTIQIRAAYYVLGDGGFVTFKDANHKQVASIYEKTLCSVELMAGQVPATSGSAGTVYVNVAPRIDESAMDSLVAEVTRRLEFFKPTGS